MTPDSLRPAAPSTPARVSRPPLSDTASLRARARKRIAEGAVVDSYRADRVAVIALLNVALATELVCMLRYKRHGFTAKGLGAEPVAAEFHAHAAEELGHADQLAARIVQLGGDPDFSPAGLADRAHAEYDASPELVDMIREDLVAERIAIESYGEVIRFLGDDDPTTRRLIESILAVEEEHADDLAGLLVKLSPASASRNVPSKELTR